MDKTVLVKAFLDISAGLRCPAPNPPHRACWKCPADRHVCLLFWMNSLLINFKAMDHE